MKECFSNGKWHKNVTTVGEMIDELTRLPRNLKVKQGFSQSADLVVFSRHNDDRHLSLEEGANGTKMQTSNHKTYSLHNTGGNRND